MRFLKFISLSSVDFCYVGSDPTAYTGEMDKTESGIACQKWADQKPHNHGKIGINEPENWCRSPPEDPEDRPWYYALVTYGGNIVMSINVQLAVYQVRR